MEPHTHTFEADPVESWEDATVECAEYIYISLPCHHREVYGSYTSDRLDETFYDEGPRCEAEKSVTLAYTIYEDGEVILASDPEREPTERRVEPSDVLPSHSEMAEALEQHVVETLAETGEFIIEFSGDEYRVEIEMESECTDL